MEIAKEALQNIVFLEYYNRGGFIPPYFARPHLGL
ncbi:MAG: hypothetical protein K0R15_2775 [Clostridiales bacterium]|jgi:hypothetical protein|nr:hypothetical protein [Clostridiales bacterium]